MEKSVGDRYTDSRIRRVPYVLIASGFLIASCVDQISSEDKQLADSATLAEQTVKSKPQADADRIWSNLTNSPSIKRVPGESELSFLMRQVEVSNLSFRENGLIFWAKFQDDPRRFKWLLQTVLMPPHYAGDLYDWSEREAKLGWNTSAMDSHSHARWEREYSKMRNEFWASPSVSDRERRLLWFGELEQNMVRAHEANARGESVDSESILVQLREFARSFPTVLEDAVWELDIREHWSIFERLFILVLNDQSGWSLLGSQPPSQYFDALVETGNDVSKSFRESRLAEREWRTRHQPKGISGLWSQLAFENTVFSYGSDFAARVRYEHDRYVAAIKERSIGATIWKESVDHEQKTMWLVRMLNVHIIYPENFGESIRKSAVDWKAKIESNEAAQLNWRRTYDQLRKEKWESPGTTFEQRKRIRAYELHRDFFDAIRSWHATGDAAHSQMLLADLVEYTEKYGYSPTVGSIMTSVLNRYHMLGLGRAEMIEFFDLQRDTEHEEVQLMVKAVRAQEELYGKPFELVASTLNGDDFDISDIYGNIILVDHWATTCASCIEAMPKIHEFYLRFKSEGFEVASVCYDCGENQDRASRLEKEMGLSWPMIVADDQWERVSSQYGYSGVPQYMLLNRDGTLYAGTAEINEGNNLENLVIRMLAAEAAEQEAATVH